MSLTLLPYFFFYSAWKFVVTGYRPARFVLTLTLLFAVLLIGLAGCGGDEQATVLVPAPPPIPAPPPPPPPPPPPAPVTVDVPLGASGGSVTLTQTDSGYTLNGESFVSGAIVTAANGDYVFTLTDGNWRADFRTKTTDVGLGISGTTVTVAVAEDGSFSVDDVALVPGGTVTAANGLDYRLTLDNGVWKARYQAAEPVQVRNTPLTAVVEEDGLYLIVGSQILLQDGMGMVSSGGRNYRVWTDEANNLVGSLYDMIGKDASMQQGSGDPDRVELSGDDAATPADESGTMLLLAGLNEDVTADASAVSLGALFDGPTPAIQEGFVEDIVEELEHGLFLLNAHFVVSVGATSTYGINRMNRIWNTANTQLAILGLGDTVLGEVPDFDDADIYETERARGVKVLEDAIAALDGIAAFTAALAVDGVFANADEDYDPGLYNAAKTSAELRFDSTRYTRFGVLGVSERTTANDDFAEEYSNFVYSPLDAVETVPFLEDVTAVYSGKTVAVTTNLDESPEVVSGVIELKARFDMERGTSFRTYQAGTLEMVVSKLENSEGGYFNNGEGDIKEITLPKATIRDTGDTVEIVVTAGDATVKYFDFLEQETLNGEIKGRFVGAGRTVEDVPLAAIGLWALTTSDSNNAAYRDLAGSFGAEFSVMVPDEVFYPPLEAGESFEFDELNRVKATLANRNVDGLIDAEEMLQLQWVDFGAEPSTADDMLINLKDKVSFADLAARKDVILTTNKGLNAVTLFHDEVVERIDIYRKHISYTDYADRGLYWQFIAGSSDAERAAYAVNVRVDFLTELVATTREYVGIELEDPFYSSPMSDINDLNIGDESYVKEALESWDKNMLDRLEGIAEAFASAADLKNAFKDRGVFEGVEGDLSIYTRTNDPIAIDDVFGRIPSKVNIILNYTEYTRFGLWTETSNNPLNEDGNPSVEQEADSKSIGTARAGRNYSRMFAYSPLGNTDSLRRNLPTTGSATYEGYTFASEADKTDIYLGDITVTIDWGDGDTMNRLDASVAVLITDLRNEDGGFWNDGRGDVNLITYHKDYGIYDGGDFLDGQQLVSFEEVEDPIWGKPVQAKPITRDNLAPETGEGFMVAGFHKQSPPTSTESGQLIEIQYSDSSTAYAAGNVNGQFLGVSAMDSGIAGQPRAIIGSWAIDAGVRTIVETDPGTRIQMIVEDGAAAAGLNGVYGADLLIQP